ncbi:MAG TPA: hypothetical protein VEC12_13760 [Bacteroidia bacterium]|nr:hypothetical protein [Bacteroidia bacterium]
MKRHFLLLLIMFPAFCFGQDTKKKFPADIKGDWYISMMVFNYDTVNATKFETLVTYYWNQEILNGKEPTASDSLELEETMPEIQELFRTIQNVTLTFYDSGYNMIIPGDEFNERDTGTYTYNKATGTLQFYSGANKDSRYYMDQNGLLVGVLVEEEDEREIVFFSRKRAVPGK